MKKFHRMDMGGFHATLLYLFSGVIGGMAKKYVPEEFSGKGEKLKKYSFFFDCLLKKCSVCV